MTKKNEPKTSNTMLPVLDINSKTANLESSASNENDTQVNWIYRLDKMGLQAKLQIYRLPIDRVVAK